MLKSEFGVYSGSYSDKQDYLNSCSEIELFFMINDKQSYIRFLKDDFIDAGHEYENILEHEYAVDYAICLTKRFDVDIESSDSLKRVSKKGEFILWYGWWHNYIYIELSPEEREELLKKIKNNFEVSNYRPDGYWKEPNHSQKEKSK